MKSPVVQKARIELSLPPFKTYDGNLDELIVKWGVKKAYYISMLLRLFLWDHFQQIYINFSSINNTPSHFSINILFDIYYF